MPERDRSIPTGRLARTAKVGGLVAGQAARAAASRAAGLARSADARDAAAERRQAEAAEQVVEVLGQMKGAAMKVGQVASFMDVGGMSPEVRERFQAKLAELRDSAPQMSFAQMRKVLEDELEQPLEEAFAEFEPAAIAAASIGQVYRARLHDGRRVAVKVQYPGVATAVRSDLQNIGLLLRAARAIAPGIDAKAMATEIRDRIGEELDYEHEAQSQRSFARQWRGHPYVVIPDVVTSLSRERVLVTEWAEGIGFEEVRRLGQAERDRFGEIVYRFFFGSLYRLGHFSGDPHPGNFRLMADGRVAFLDFGMTRTVDAGHLRLERRAVRAGLDGNAEGLHAALATLGYFDPADPVLAPALVLEHFRAAADWYLEDREVGLDPVYVGRLLIDMGDPRSRFWELMKRETVPAAGMLARRMETLVLAVLGQLEARGNWHRMARELLFGEPPATAIGEAEAAYFARAGVPPLGLTGARRAA